METPNRSSLLACIEDMLTAQVLLDLEHGIHALCRHVALVRLVEEKRGVLPVVDNDVDLLAAGTMRINYERTISLVPVRKVILQNAQPVLFGGLSASSWMPNGNSIATEPALKTCLQTI